MDFDISMGGAFLAGLISFVSPCVLPIVPPYLCYIAGVSMQELSVSDTNDRTTYRRIIFSALAFVIGFSTVFTALGASATFVGQWLAQYFHILSIIAGIIIIIFGLHFLGLLKVSWLYRDTRLQVDRGKGGFLSAYIMGLAFAFGWTPCVGPVLAAILFTAGAEETALHGALLLLVYSLGIGLPFLAAAVFSGPFLKFAARFRKHMGIIEKVMGILLIVTGILFMTGQMSLIAQWLIDYVPALATIG